MDCFVAEAPRNDGVRQALTFSRRDFTRVVLGLLVLEIKRAQGMPDAERTR